MKDTVPSISPFRDRNADKKKPFSFYSCAKVNQDARMNDEAVENTVINQY